MPRAPRTLLAVIGAAATVAIACLVSPTSGAFTARITNSDDTAKAATTFRCTDTFSAATNATNAYFEYTLSEATGTTVAVDSSTAGNAGVYRSTHTATTTAPKTACPNDVSKVSYAPAGTSGTPQYLTTTTPVGTSPAVFSLVIWFRTSTKAGQLIGLGANQTGANTTYDRMIYFEPSGQLAFGTFSSPTYQIVETPNGTNYADGVWHQAVATFTAGTPNTGMSLYVDGALSASNATYTTAETDAGYWRIGYEGLSTAWTGSLFSPGYFTGSLKFAAAYRYVLSPAEIRSQYSIGAPG